MEYQLNGEALEYKLPAGQFAACTCPFVDAAVCTLACPLLRIENIDAGGHTRAYLCCGNGRELVLTV
jgi:hypothetical protein